MVTSFIKWTKKRLLTHLLGRINNNFLECFVDLPGSFSLGGFMDQLELTDVCLDTSFISRELYRAQIPVRVKYGHIGKLKLNLYLTKSASHIILEDALIILAPHLNWFDLPSTIDANLKVLRKHITEVVKTVTSQISPDEFHFNGTNLIEWLFRYDPNLTMFVKNIHIRFEDDALFPGHSSGLVWESLLIRPSSHFWEFTWPTEAHPNDFSLGPLKHSASGQHKGTEATSALHAINVTHPCVNSSCYSSDGRLSDLDHSSSGTAMTNRTENLEGHKPSDRSIFAGIVKGIGIYFNSNSRSWVPWDLIQATDQTRGSIYKILPYNEIQKTAKNDLQNHNWIVEPFDFSFQFGLQSASQPDNDLLLTHNHIANAVSKQPFKKVVSGGKFLFRMSRTIRVVLDEEVISNAVRMFHAKKQFERWKVLRTYRPFAMHSNSDLSDNIKLVSRSRWKYSQIYLSFLRKELGFPNLKFEINSRINHKRRFSRLIRQWLLQFHFTHPKGIIKATSNYPIIDRCFRLLSSQFIWAREYNNTSHYSLLQDATIYNTTKNSNFINQKCVGISQDHKEEHFCEGRYLKLTHRLRNRKCEINQENNISVMECCTEKDFDDLGLSSPPLGYFFLIPSWKLRELANEKEDVRFLLELLMCRAHTTIAQWYLLAVREVEEIICLTRRVVIGGNLIAQDLIIKIPNIIVSVESDCPPDRIEETKALGIYADSINVEAMVQFLEHDDSFISTIRQALHFQKSNRPELSQKLRLSPLWSRAKLKNEIYADFYDAYVSCFPSISCENVDLRSLFAFKDHISSATGLKSSRAIDSILLNQYAAKPAVPINPAPLTATELITQTTDKSQITANHTTFAVQRSSAPQFLESPLMTAVSAWQRKDELIQEGITSYPSMIQNKSLLPVRVHRELPWDTLIANGPQVDPILRTLVDEGGYLLPDWLWNLSLGFCFHEVEISVREKRQKIVRPQAPSRQAAVSLGFSRGAPFNSGLETGDIKQPKIFGLVISSLGIEARLQQKLLLTSVCQHLDFVDFSYLRDGTPLNLNIKESLNLSSRTSEYQKLGLPFASVSYGGVDRFVYQKPNKINLQQLSMATCNETLDGQSSLMDFTATSVMDQHSNDFRYQSSENNEANTGLKRTTKDLQLALPITKSSDILGDMGELNSCSDISSSDNEASLSLNSDLGSDEEVRNIQSVDKSGQNPYFPQSELDVGTHPLSVETTSLRNYGVEPSEASMPILEESCSYRRPALHLDQKFSTPLRSSIREQRPKASSLDDERSSLSCSFYQGALYSAPSTGVNVMNNLQSSPKYRRSVISPQWSFMSLTVMTKAMANRIYRIELPLFGDLEIHVTDIQVHFQPKLIDDVRHLVVRFYDSFFTTSFTCVDEAGVLEWSSAKQQGVQPNVLDYRASFLAKVLPVYFPSTTTTFDPIQLFQFWDERLAYILGTSDASSSFPEEHKQHRYHQSPSRVIPATSLYRVPSIAETIPLRGVKQQLKSATFPHSRFDAAVEKSHVSIRIRLPGISVTIFSLTDESTTPIEIAQLQMSSDSLVILTGKRQDGLYLAARSNTMKFATKKSLQHCLALYPILRRIIDQRRLEFITLMQHLEELTQLKISSLFGSAAVNGLRRGAEANERFFNVLLKYQVFFKNVAGNKSKPSVDNRDTCPLDLPQFALSNGAIQSDSLDSTKSITKEKQTKPTLLQISSAGVSCSTALKAQHSATSRPVSNCMHPMIDPTVEVRGLHGTLPRKKLRLRPFQSPLSNREASAPTIHNTQTSNLFDSASGRSSEMATVNQFSSRTLRSFFNNSKGTNNTSTNVAVQRKTGTMAGNSSSLNAKRKVDRTPSTSIKCLTQELNQMNNVPSIPNTYCCRSSNSPFLLPKQIAPPARNEQCFALSGHYQKKQQQQRLFAPQSSTKFHVQENTFPIFSSTRKSIESQHQSYQLSQSKALKLPEWSHLRSTSHPQKLDSQSTTAVKSLSLSSPRRPDTESLRFQPLSSSPPWLNFPIIVEPIATSTNRNTAHHLSPPLQNSMNQSPLQHSVGQSIEESRRAFHDSPTHISRSSEYPSSAIHSIPFVLYPSSHRDSGANPVWRNIEDPRHRENPS